MFHHGHCFIAAPAFSWRSAHEPGSLHTGQRADAGDHTLKESHLLNRLFVAGLGQAEVHGQHVVDRYADVGGPQALVALQQKPRSDQQNYSEADFENKKCSAKSGSRRPALCALDDS